MVISTLPKEDLFDLRDLNGLGTKLTNVNIIYNTICKIIKNANLFKLFIEESVGGITE